jgi:hypothetical protein
MSPVPYFQCSRVHSSNVVTIWRSLLETIFYPYYRPGRKPRSCLMFTLPASNRRSLGPRTIHLTVGTSEHHNRQSGVRSSPLVVHRLHRRTSTAGGPSPVPTTCLHTKLVGVRGRWTEIPDRLPIADAADVPLKNPFGPRLSPMS